MTDPFVPDDDLLEQTTPVLPDPEESEGDTEAVLPSDIGGGRWEADEADILDQNREVPLDDDRQ